MKKIIILVSLIFISLFNLNIYANGNKIVDKTDSLSESEIEELNDELRTLVDNTGFDVVVYFAYEMADVTELADDYFDYNGYGLGNDKEGIILCVNYYDRDYTITTSGSKTKKLFNEDALNYIYDNVTSYLSNGNKVGAVREFIEDINYICSDEYSDLRMQDNIKSSLIIGVFGALIISLVTFLILRGQLKTQGIKKEAYDYVNKASVDVFRSGEIFLYKNISRRRIERSQGSGGSGSHISSSGRSHGGGGSHRF
jgi:uncharacterized protein